MLQPIAVQMQVLQTHHHHHHHHPSLPLSLSQDTTIEIQDVVQWPNCTRAFESAPEDPTHFRRMVAVLTARYASVQHVWVDQGVRYEPPLTQWDPMYLVHPWGPHTAEAWADEWQHVTEGACCV